MAARCPHCASDTPGRHYRDLCPGDASLRPIREPSVTHFEIGQWWPEEPRQRADGPRLVITAVDPTAGLLTVKEDK